MKDNDIAVLVDAYDVLLFPSIRRLPSVLAHSPTPLLFCSEDGIYPEFTASWFYRRGASVRRSTLRQSFLNSGCIAGRVGEMRTMFQSTLDEGLFYRDDQHVFVRYLLQHPHLVGLDGPTAPRRDLAFRGMEEFSHGLVEGGGGGSAGHMVTPLSTCH